MISRRENVVTYAILGLFAVFAIYPFISTVLVAFNPPDPAVSGLAIPHDWSLESFRSAWTNADAGIGRSLLNSLILAVAVVPLSVLLSILTGYAFGTMEFRGSKVLFYLFLLGMMVPYEATVIPLYYQFRDMGML